MGEGGRQKRKKVGGEIEGEGREGRRGGSERERGRGGERKVILLERENNKEQEKYCVWGQKWVVVIILFKAVLEHIIIAQYS